MHRILRRFLVPAALVLTSVAAANALRAESSCNYTWGEAQPCVRQYNECTDDFGHPEADCAGAFNGCNAGLCMTLHSGCEETCNSLPQMPV